MCYLLFTAIPICFLLKENLRYLKKGGMIFFTSALENYYHEIQSDNDFQLRELKYIESLGSLNYLTIMLLISTFK